MPRLRLVLVLAVTALAAAALVQGAAAAAPTAITGSVSAVGGASATLNGTVNPGRRRDRVVVRVRHHDLLRLGDDPHEHRLRLGECPRLAIADRALGCDDLPLPARGEERVRHRERRRRALHDRIAAGRRHVPATGVGPTTATLGGTVNPNGEPTTWFVEYGTSTSYGSKSATADAGSGTAAKAVSVGVTRPHRRQDLPLPPRRDELGRNRQRRGCDVRDGGGLRLPRPPRQARSPAPVRSSTARSIRTDARRRTGSSTARRRPTAPPPPRRARAAEQRDERFEDT